MTDTVQGGPQELPKTAPGPFTQGQTTQQKSAENPPKNDGLPPHGWKQKRK